MIGKTKLKFCISFVWFVLFLYYFFNILILMLPLVQQVV